jgi:hypothetical protein
MSTEHSPARTRGPAALTLKAAVQQMNEEPYALIRLPRDSSESMAVTANDLAGQLHELIAALDRRVPRVGHASEDAIVRDAAALREKAVQRLKELEASGVALLDPGNRSPQVLQSATSPVR